MAFGDRRSWSACSMCRARGDPGIVAENSEVEKEVLSVMAMTRSAMRGAIQAAKALGSALSRAGLSAVSLDEHSVLAAARRAARLDDFGDEGFREPLGVLLRDLDTESRLTFLGRIVARHDIVGLLANRLRLEDDR